MENYVYLVASIYIAKNQNGFAQAVYEECYDGSHTKKELREMLQSYPKSYPCIFSIDDNSFEESRIYIHIYDKDGLETSLKNALEILQNIEG
jgi:hypothetical protein